MRRLRRILIADSPIASSGAADVIVWLGTDEPPTALERDRLVVRASSPRAAAVYVAAGPAEICLALAEPLGFMRLLAEVSSRPALRAA